MTKSGVLFLLASLAVSCADSPTTPVPAEGPVMAAADVPATDPSALQAGCTVPPFPKTSQTVFQTDVTYNVIGGTALKLDLAAPKNPSSPRPLVVFIHGGGWDSGSKKAHRTEILRLTSLRYAAATVDYRLAPQYRFPAQIQDVACAIDWLRANATKYGIDPGRVAVVGHSAGGELAALYGVAGAAAALHGPCTTPPQSTHVSGVVAFSTPFDLTNLSLMDASALQKIVAYLGGSPLVKHWAGIMASPYYHVGSASPPFFMAHGRYDPLIYVGQSRLMAAKLTKKGVPNTLVQLNISIHDILFLDTSPQYMASTCGMLSFLQSTLKP